MTLASAASADEFKLSNNQRISCSRGLSAGKLNTATCKSYAYLFNTKTSEYFRCQVSLALTRDNKEVINVQTDGGCTKKPRIFDTDGNYSFDATETEPPNTNSFFGPGGYSVWASDNNAPEGPGLHHHLVRPRLRHLEMPRHDVPVSRGRRFMPSARRPIPATRASGRTSLPPSACRTDSPGPGRSPGRWRRRNRRGSRRPAPAHARRSPGRARRCGGIPSASAARRRQPVTN